MHNYVLQAKNYDIFTTTVNTVSQSKQQSVGAI